MKEHKLKLSLLSKAKEYICQFEWPDDCFVQGGDSGVVLSKNGNYQTAFVEAFPKNPNTFIRGEGRTLEEAEKSAWEQFQKHSKCTHPGFERRSYQNGAGFCIGCGMFKSDAFEPTTKCCVCKKPTCYTTDINSRWYCENHPVPEDLKHKWQKEFDKFETSEED